jgi:acyl-coenzyme A thioesterase PaaI-like protein
MIGDFVNITDIPFNKHIGLQRIEGDNTALLSLPVAPEYFNHIGTVHASAQFALAEASSGEFLLRSVGELRDILPVVRRSEIKFRKPANGRLIARSKVDADQVEAFFKTLKERGRASIAVSIEIVDESNVTTATATFEWFVQKTV